MSTTSVAEYSEQACKTRTGHVRPAYNFRIMQELGLLFWAGLAKISVDVDAGQRYGYSVTKPYGYNYITGGGGIILNR